MGSNDEINNYISRLRRQCELNVAIDEGNNISLRKKKYKSSRLGFYLLLVGIVAVYFVVLSMIYMR